MSNQKNFALIGAAGYVAPKHMKAIKETGNRLIAAIDKSDSVGILDSFSYDVSFFTEFERFDRHAEKLRRLSDEKKIHFVSICSPNYLHDAHIRFALRIGADAICEKPLVLNTWNLDALSELEKETGKKVYNILQLRCHPSIMALKKKIDYDKKTDDSRETDNDKKTDDNKEIDNNKKTDDSRETDNDKKIDNTKKTKKHEIALSYITSRGNWYLSSWKGVLEKSGGIATNIGIHFFDMLMWLFGKVQYYELYVAESTKMSGFIELEKANVRWFLSIDRNDLPQEGVQKGISTYRSITVDGEEIEFSGGFTDLHTMVYQDILNGKGYGIEDARGSIELVSNFRNMALLK